MLVFNSLSPDPLCLTLAAIISNGDPWGMGQALLGKATFFILVGLMSLEEKAHTLAASGPGKPDLACAHSRLSAVEPLQDSTRPWLQDS